MKKDKKYYIIEFIILIFIIIFTILSNKIPIQYANLINIIFWFLMGITLFIIGGFPRNRNYYQKSSIKIVLIVFLFYIIITYLLGLFLGFIKNLYFYNLILLIKQILPISLFIIFSETSRYLILKHNLSNLQKIILTLEFIILNIIIGINGYSFIDFKHVFVLVSTIILPTIASELMAFYVTSKVGLIPTIIYKLLFNLLGYIVPFSPNLGDYLHAVSGLLVPFVIYNEVKKNLKYKEKYGKILNSTIKKVFSGILIIFLIVIVLLVSGIFKYQLIAIATGSMEPIYYRGDAVIYEKVKPKDIIEGDILVYTSTGGIITHRVIKIEEKNGKRIFYTKGDNNLTDDKIEIGENNVRGRVKYIVKYLGYPTILLNDYLESKG